MKYLFTVTAILLVIGFSVNSDAKIFMWVDEDGNKHYSNTGYQGNPQEVNEIQNKSSVQSFKTPEHQPVKPVQESTEDKDNVNDSIVSDDDKPNQISESIENKTDNISAEPPKSNYSNSGGSSQISTHTITKTSTQKTRIIKRNSVNINSSKAVGPSLNKFQPNSITNQRSGIHRKTRNVKDVDQNSQANKIKEINRKIEKENQRKLEEYNAKVKEIEKRNEQIRKDNERKVTEYNKQVQEYNEKVKETEKRNAAIREHNRKVQEHNASIRKTQSNQNRSSSRKPYLGKDDPNRPFYQRHPAERSWGK